MIKVYYIGFYGDDLAYRENRNIHPAGVNKMDYIARTLGDVGAKVRIISPAWLKYKKEMGFKISSKRKFSLNYNVDCILPFSIAIPFRIMQVIPILISKIWLIIYFLFNIKKDDKVVVYNSPFYFTTLYWLKRIIKFNLILEVEEVYSIVFSMGKKWYKKECRLIDAADSYIFPNDLINNYLQVKDKQQIVVYGSYLTNENEVKPVEFEDGKIHLVYAGIIDKLKLGAFNAVRSAKYLPDNYIMHILGFGTAKDVGDLIQEIHESNIVSPCKVFYEGKKTGTDYISFVSGCQIGLSTQKNEGEYLKFTFPSKVLGYLTMGLNVVSGEIEGVKLSDVGSMVAYYSEDSPEKIAETIKNMKIINHEIIKSRINNLDINFRVGIKKLLCQTF